MRSIPMPRLPVALQGRNRGDVLTKVENGELPSTQVTVDPRDLLNTQPDVANTPYIPTPSNGPPIVAKKNGKLYVLDGHNRKYDAIKSKSGLNVLIVDLDK